MTYYYAVRDGHEYTYKAASELQAMVAAEDWGLEYMGPLDNFIEITDEVIAMIEGCGETIH